MTRNQEVQLKAILARFDGDLMQAIVYCKSMSDRYPYLAVEYETYRVHLLALNLYSLVAQAVNA